MKLKLRPDDFQVEELADLSVNSTGAYALYTLEKRNLGTPEAIRIICRAWKLDSERVGYGGLKDTHALSKQFFTVHRGPRRNLRRKNLWVHHVGQTAEPFGPRRITGNRFVITVYDLPDMAGFHNALNEVRRDGFVNYFDDQRFGSVAADGRFIARLLMDGDFESGLKLALIEPYAYDNAEKRREKGLLRRLWGNWNRLRDDMSAGVARDVVWHLVRNPNDFRGAFARLPRDLSGLYLAAYQGHVWNRVLALWLSTRFAPARLVWVRTKLAQLPMYQGLKDEERAGLIDQTLPLPSARVKLADQDPLKPLLSRVLLEDGLDLSRFKLKHLREPFFAKGDRPVLVVPKELKDVNLPDERHSGRCKVRLTFVLPRGAYATMLVKRIGANFPSLSHPVQPG